MADNKSNNMNNIEPMRQRRLALSRWDNEDGAGCKTKTALSSEKEQWDKPEMSNADLVQLRIRIIALENILISLLAEASNGQLELVREMACCISPKEGFTEHPLTIHAATQMNHLVDRAMHFRKTTDI